jgi:hypothetical protein
MRAVHAVQLAMAAELSASIVHEISQPLAAVVANGKAGLHWCLRSHRIVRTGLPRSNAWSGTARMLERS